METQMVYKWTFLAVILASAFVRISESRTHHKVHNLALYPERHSWCQATPIRQEIAHPPECEAKVIDNMVCLGACFSYSVPRAQDYHPIAPYCDKCDKTFSSWTVISLNCTRESGEKYQLTRTVELITNCSCVDCNDNSARRMETESSEDPGNSLEDEYPDALEGNELQKDRLRAGLHKLKGVPGDMNEFNSNKDDEDLMINDNKIPSDEDDHDHDSARQRTNLNTDHDL